MHKTEDASRVSAAQSRNTDDAAANERAGAGLCLSCGRRLTSGRSPITDYIQCSNCNVVNVYRDSSSPIGVVPGGKSDVS